MLTLPGPTQLPARLISPYAIVRVQKAEEFLTYLSLE